MSLTSALAAGRRAAVSRMTSTATVRRPGGKVTDANGFEVDGWTVVYSGPFRLGGSQRDGASRNVRIADVEVTLAARVAHFPAGTEGLRDGDLIEVTSGENTGAVLRIAEASWQDQATALRVPVVEAQAPAGGWS